MDTFPFVSFIVLSYNQEAYIKSALDGAGNQSYPNYEIIISDDCSTDSTKEKINEWLSSYSEGHPVIFNHNDKNLGLVGNLNVALSLSKGVYFILAAGDDISLPNRTMASVNMIKKLGVDSLALNFEYIDKDGIQQNRTGFEKGNYGKVFSKTDYIKGMSPLPSGPSRIITRKIIDFFGLLQNDCQTEDTTLTFRSILLGGVGYGSEVEVLYRWHDSNISAEHNLMTRINPIKIYKQYRRDLEVAVNKRLVTKDEFNIIDKKIYNYKVEQVYKRRLYRTKNNLDKVVWHLLFWCNPSVPRTLKTKSNLKLYWPKMFKMAQYVKSIKNK